MLLEEHDPIWFELRHLHIAHVRFNFKSFLFYEFKRVIASLRGHDDKIRVVLNKADQVDTQQV